MGMGSLQAEISVTDALEAEIDCCVVVAAATEEKNSAIALNRPMNCVVQERACAGQQELHRMNGLGCQR